MQTALYFLLSIFPFLAIIGIPLGIGLDIMQQNFFFSFGFFAFCQARQNKIAIVFLGYLFARAVLCNHYYTFTEVCRCIGLFGVIFWIAQNKTDTIKIIRILSITATIEFVFVMFPGLLHWSRIPDTIGLIGTFGHENRVSSFYLVVLPMAIFGATIKQEYEWRVIHWIAAIFSIVVLIGCGSRAGAMLVLFEIGAIIFYFNHKKRWMKYFSISILIMAIIYGGYNLWFGIARSQIDCPERLHFWKAAWEMIKACPIFGIGPGLWGKVYYSVWHVGGWNHCHNEPLQLLSEIGIIGFSLFYTFIGWLLWNIRFRFWYALPIVVILIHSLIACMRTIEQTFYFAIMAGLALQNEKTKL